MTSNFQIVGNFLTKKNKNKNSPQGQRSRSYVTKI